MIDWITMSPSPHTHLSRYMLEAVRVRLEFVAPCPPEQMQAQVWTNMPTRLNSDGGWYPINLSYRGNGQGPTHCFQGALQPTSSGAFELTYRVVLPSPGGVREELPEPSVFWCAGLGENVLLEIMPPSDILDWTQGPSLAEVTPGVYVGNFIAASQAAELGLDAVLNMAEELDGPLLAAGAIAYQKLGCRDGAQHPIPEAYIQTAVHWIESQRSQGRQKILIHCRAGIGRSGSIGLAYCFYKHPQWSYQQTLEHVWSLKPDIYPHRELQVSLEKLFPR